MQLTIKRANKFNAGGKSCLGFTFDYNGAEYEGVLWGHAMVDTATAGCTIDIQGDDKDVKWDQYKGKTRLNVRERATITVVGGVAQGPPAPPAFQPPAAAPQSFTPPTPPPVALPTQQSQGKELDVIQKASWMQAQYVQALEANQFSREEAITIASGAGNIAEIYAKWWFGEKGL